MTTLSLSAALLIVVAPYMNDPHWDAPIALVMSLATFATAPWAVGALWRHRSVASVAGALVAWLASAGWSFDAYWWARRGFYPDVWRENLAASSMLYLAAGLLWNLDWTPERKLHLAFRDPDWPAQRPPPPFRRIALPVLLVMAATAAALLLPFWL
ncbi:MAG TPA: hypothetical protein VFF06_15150 [Polyangia bacterium]|nr:hypothetical protein [Polyangia bacterium]